MSARALLVLAALACGCAGVEGGDDDPEPKPNVEKIPLKSIHVSFEQEGTKHFRQGSAEDPDNELSALFILDPVPLKRQLLLVRADKIGEAARAARRAIVGEREGDKPNTAEGHWLVAYLGATHSEPPAISVKSAERRGRTIRLDVQELKPDGGVTKNLHPYFVWVPLGKLPHGKYALELYEDGQKETSMSREQTVGK